MILAVEDPLTEAVARRVIAVTRPDLTIWTVMGLTGFGYLRRKCRELNQTARSVPVMILTDQDGPANCPPTLIAEWLPVPMNANLFFRVAVMEVESWVIADRGSFATMLGIPVDRVPEDTDAIRQPKEFIVELARRSRSRDVRDDLVPATGATSTVGPAYNPRLTGFVTSTWDPQRAATHSQSLARTISRLGTAFRIGA